MASIRTFHTTSQPVVCVTHILVGTPRVHGQTRGPHTEPPTTWGSLLLVCRQALWKPTDRDIQSCLSHLVSVLCLCNAWKLRPPSSCNVGKGGAVCGPREPFHRGHLETRNNQSTSFPVHHSVCMRKDDVAGASWAEGAGSHRSRLGVDADAAAALRV